MKFLFLPILLSLVLTLAWQCSKYPIHTQANFQNLKKFNWTYLFDTTHLTDEPIVDKRKKTILYTFLDSICYKEGEYLIPPNTQGRPYLFHEYANFFLYTQNGLSKITYLRENKTLDLIFLLPYISREATFIESVYEKYKVDILQTIDTTLAHRIGLDFIVDDLLFTYDTLFRNKKAKNVFKKYSFNSSLVHQEIRIIVNGCPPYVNGKAIYKPFSGYEEWIYTFWYRRYVENNIDICLKILKEMQKKYPPRKKYAWRYNWQKTIEERKKRNFSKLSAEEQKEVDKIIKEINLFSKQ